MKPAALLTAILSLPLDSLEMIQVVIADKVSNLQADERVLSKSKSHATKVGQDFLKEFPALQAVKTGRPFKNPDLSSKILECIKLHPGCSKPDVMGLLPMTSGQWKVSIKKLKRTGQVVMHGTKRLAVYYLKGSL